MNLAKYIVLGIVNGIFNIYPVSYKTHIIIYQELFNTKIFYDEKIISLLNLATFISIILLYRNDIINFILRILKDIIKRNRNKNKDKKEYKMVNKNYKYIRCIAITMIINTLIYVFVPYKIKNIRNLAYFYIITSIILLFTRGKNGQKKYDEVTYIDAFIIGLSSFLSIVPSIPILLCNLLSATKQKLTKKTSLRYALTCLLPILFIDSIPGIIYIINDQTYLLEIMICFVIAIFTSSCIFKSLKYMYYTNKLYRLALYTLFLAIFIFYWFV